MVRLAIAVLLALPLSRPQDKAPVPPAQAQKDAEALIKGIFKDEYAKKTPEGQQALAKKLLQQGRETSNDAAAQYVLFREAADVASKAGDVAAALDAAKAISDHFDVDAVAVKTKLLLDAPATFRTPELAKAYGELCLTAAGEACAVDRLDEAKGVLGKAEAAAKAAKDPGLVSRVQKQRKELEALQAEAQKAKAGEVTLQSNPDDPAANLAVGRYLVAKGKLDQAVAHLAKGSDAALKAAAQKDAAAGKESDSQLQAGNGWWDAAEKEKEGPFRKALQERARERYEAAYAAATGLSRVAIEKRLDVLDRATSAAPEGPPTLRLMTFAEFDAIAAQYPHERDLAAKFGKATASSQFQNRDPNNVFKGNRRSDAWTLGKCPGWFEAKWDPPVRGRTLLLVGRNVPLGNDQWGQATLILNGSIKLPLSGMCASKVVVVELGTARRLESLRAEIPATGGYPGLGTVEVFR
jgi:hypothetical protein